ncbi:hypothetical protein F0562_024050 [Nyssa sinensis]|uniref:Retrotransposon gag domain-containing protein n=1 Tax=Nyssa sinensis TaxID=561372 RepID=A0A5J5BID4_9ASTE|nr:hypothetical protein F0562_024050 [Nyssa sinensis]
MIPINSTPLKGTQLQQVMMVIALQKIWVKAVKLILSNPSSIRHRTISPFDQVGNEAQIYDLRKRVHETKETDLSVVEYYAGLNDLNAEYDQIRSQVLGRDPFPTLRQAYAFVQLEEGRRGQ